MAELTSEQQALRDELVGQYDTAKRWRQPLVDRWTHFYRQYRSYQDFRNAHASATDRRDRDDIIGDGKREWGADLFIPWTYWTIETILPRVISNRPRGAVLPEDPEADENVQNMRHTIERQQEQIKYELVGQATAKNGLIYGLGGQKTRWRYECRERPFLQRATLPGGEVEWTVSDPRKVVEFDDADAVNIDIFDWFWDPVAADPYSSRWLMHRVWKDTSYVWDLIERGVWGAMPGLTWEDIDSLGPQDKYDDVKRERLVDQGQTDTGRRGDQLHEVWEWHTGTRLLVVIDQTYVVYDGPNPAWHGRMPFHAFRPTFLEGEFCGIGEPEQIEHLQAEMNTLRGQRRDNATLSLMQAYAYDLGRVDPANIKIGPGTLSGVNGDPNNVLMPLVVKDIPFSGYREEEHLAADIERVTGISDAVSGTQTAGGTATEAQLTVSQANIRIQNKTRRLELEVIAGVIGDWIDLNQQMIVQERHVRIPYTPMPGEPAQRVWAWKKMGPAELAGRFSYVVEGGSTGPHNLPERMQKAQMMLTALPLLGGIVDPRLWVQSILENMGFQQPEAFMAPDDRLPPETLDFIGQKLLESGVQPPQVQMLLEQAVQAGQQAAQQANAEQQGIQQGGGPSGEPPQPPEG